MGTTRPWPTVLPPVHIAFTVVLQISEMAETFTNRTIKHLEAITASLQIPSPKYSLITRSVLDIYATQHNFQVLRLSSIVCCNQCKNLDVAIRVERTKRHGMRRMQRHLTCTTCGQRTIRRGDSLETHRQHEFSEKGIVVLGRMDVVSHDHDNSTSEAQSELTTIQGTKQAVPSSVDTGRTPKHRRKKRKGGLDALLKESRIESSEKTQLRSTALSDLFRQI